MFGHSLTPCVCGSWLQSLVWQVDEAGLLAVAPKHLLFTGSSCVLFRGHFSPSGEVLFDRYFTARCRGCFYFLHVCVYITLVMEEAFLMPSHDALEQQRDR